jgi:hypothetical protein
MGISRHSGSRSPDGYLRWRSYDQNLFAQPAAPLAMTPQQKKQLSYERDRRNTYGENHAASLKGIRQRKRTAARAGRRISHQKLGTIHCIDDAVEDSVSDLTFQPPATWKKSPDEPLGSVLTRYATWELEAALGANAPKFPSLITSFMEALPEAEFTATDRAYVARIFSPEIDGHGRAALKLPLHQAQIALRIARQLLAQHGIEPLARRKAIQSPEST